LGLGVWMCSGCSGSCIDEDMIGIGFGRVMAGVHDRSGAESAGSTTFGYVSDLGVGG
jgi:hypothetical protein